MAYDEQGNYYFNPQVDEDDAELYRDELKRQQVREVVKTQQKQNQEASDFNKMWTETLESEGLTPEVYTELYNAAPDEAKAHLKQAMHHVARNIKQGRGRNPKTGQFIKGQPQTGGPQQQQTERSSETQERLAELKERTTKRHSTDEDIHDVLDALFPSGL